MVGQSYYQSEMTPTRSEAVTILDLKEGMNLVQTIHARTNLPVPVVTGAGREIARLVPARALSDRHVQLISISGRLFRKNRVRFLYAAYWGVSWLIEQRGGHYVLTPPSEYPADVNPRRFGLTWAVRGEQPFSPQEAEQQFGRTGGPPPTDLGDHSRILLQIVHELSAINQRMSALERQAQMHGRPETSRAGLRRERGRTRTS